MPFSSPPAAAPLPGCAFHWQTRPCHGETVSGDDLFLETGRADEQEILLLLVDVMGHGPSAAAIVAHLRNVLLPDPHCWNLRPAGLLTLLNSWLAPVWNQESIFVAAQVVLVQVDGKLTGSNAAIPDPRQRTPAPGSVAWNLPGGTMLGPVTPQAYTEDVLYLAPGHGLLAFTDGVSEAGNPHFGTALLDAFLVADPLGPGLVGRLFAALHQHVQAGWPADDTTAYWLERPMAPDAVVDPGLSWGGSGEV
jgi:hypothetical protein